jgi:hypothetical protein
LATQLGNQYRGFGILVASLGVLAAWSELYPLDGKWSLLANHARAALLWAIVIVVIWGNRSGLRDRWTEARVHAEAERQALLTTKLLDEREQATDLQYLCCTLLDEQIAYNHRCCVQYSNILTLSRTLAFAAFVLVLTHATLELAPNLTLPFPWLGRGQVEFWAMTAFPTLIGGIAAANAFLRLGSLRDEHRGMASQLRNLRNELCELDASNTAELRNSAQAICDQLRRNDLGWREATGRTKLEIG